MAEPPQAERKYQRNQGSGDQAEGAFSGIALMQRSEEYGQHECSRPEADAARQGVEQIAAQHELFRHADQETGQAPGGCVAQHSTERHVHLAEREMVGRQQNADQQRQKTKSADQSDEELASAIESGEAIKSSVPMFQPRHTCGGQQHRQQDARLRKNGYRRMEVTASCAAQADGEVKVEPSASPIRQETIAQARPAT